MRAGFSRKVINSALDIFESKVRIGHSDELELERAMKTGESGVGIMCLLEPQKQLQLSKG